ncbi:dihydrodipicolinate synthase family protein [Pontibacillus halophilus]|nr:dihydrodipicolinate synthetase [Pontibacillus halophilus]
MATSLSTDQLKLLHEGTVIPAHPLALTNDKSLDERRQRALTRYYIESGAGGIAVGVHTTQFEIRDPEVQLLEPVLRLASEEVERAGLTRPFLKIAGVCGPLEQALEEAKLAYSYGYDLILVSMGGLPSYSEREHLHRISELSSVLPVCGFYLQPSVGGRTFPYSFWKEFVEIEGVVAIKLAPFNRYQTLDVVRAVCESRRRDDVALYTGNDDNIVADLLTPYTFTVNGEQVTKHFAGGLLGQWAVWTSKAVELYEEIRVAKANKEIPLTLLQKGIELTDCNAVLFDVAHDFKGCIAGINEVLRRQGLLASSICLSEKEVLSKGQSQAIDRVYASYPHLTDDAFVSKHRSRWLHECKEATTKER